MIYCAPLILVLNFCFDKTRNNIYISNFGKRSNGFETNNDISNIHSVSFEDGIADSTVTFMYGIAQNPLYNDINPRKITVNRTSFS